MSDLFNFDKSGMLLAVCKASPERDESRSFNSVALQQVAGTVLVAILGTTSVRPMHYHRHSRRGLSAGIPSWARIGRTERAQSAAQTS